MRDAQFFTEQTAKAFNWLTHGVVVTPDLKAMIQAQVVLMLQVAYLEGRKTMLEEAVAAAQGAQLPAGYVYGRDALDIFKCGVIEAARAVNALPLLSATSAEPPPSPPTPEASS